MGNGARAHGRMVSSAAGGADASRQEAKSVTSPLLDSEIGAVFMEL